MYKNMFVAFITAASLMAILASCSKEQSASAALTCVDLDKVTDPVQKSALQEKCGRGGPKFKPSPKQSY